MTKSRKKHITKLICSFSLCFSVFIFHGVPVYAFHDIISLPAAEFHNIRLRYIHGTHLRRKVMTLYSIENRQPVAFTKQPGNLPDVTSVTNAINQLSALGVSTTEIITDNGYYSEQNFSELLLAGFDFITLAKTSIKWIKPEIDKQRGALDDFRSMCPFDPSTHGVSVLPMHDFEKRRKYANHKIGAEKGSIETFSRRIYLNIYFNHSRQSADKAAFEADLFELKTLHDV